MHTSLYAFLSCFIHRTDDYYLIPLVYLGFAEYLFSSQMIETEKGRREEFEWVLLDGEIPWGAIIYYKRVC